MSLKVSVSEGRRPEEESSFWKISAERSRLEGEQADFQSLTPSQIKSLEKGEKSLPSYLRQVRLNSASVSHCLVAFLLLGTSSKFLICEFLTNNRLGASATQTLAVCLMEWCVCWNRVESEAEISSICGASTSVREADGEGSQYAVSKATVNILVFSSSFSVFLHIIITVILNCTARSASSRAVIPNPGVRVPLGVDKHIAGTWKHLLICFQDSRSFHKPIAKMTRALKN